MSKGGLERRFQTDRGDISLNQHEGNIRWSSDNQGPHIYTEALDKKKTDALGLNAEQIIDLNNQYLNWISQEHCNNCSLLDTKCSGFKPISSSLDVGVGRKEIQQYEARLKDYWSIYDLSYDGTRSLLQKGACKPEDTFRQKLAEILSLVGDVLFNPGY